MKAENEGEVIKKEPYCIAPWTSLYLRNDGKAFPCCHWTRFSPIGQLSEGSLDEIWNSTPMKDLRLDMLSYKQHHSCQDCRFYENAGFKSLRDDYNETQKAHISRFRKTQPDGKADPISLINLSVAVGNTCQLQCRTCGPTDSSKWQKYLNFKIDDFQHSDHIKKLEELVANSPNLERLLFVGGEPTINQLHYSLLDYLLNSNRESLPELHYNSNLVQIRWGKYNLTDYWSKFPKINLFVSIDGDKKRFSFVRTGHSWPLLAQNLLELNQSLENISYTAYVTVSIYNFLYLRELISDILELKTFGPDRILFNIVKIPTHMSCGIASPILKKIAKERIVSFIGELMLQYDLKDIARLTSGLRSVIHFLETQSHSEREFQNFLLFNERFKPDEKYGKFENLFEELQVKLN